MSKSEMNADALRNPEIDPVSAPGEEPALTTPETSGSSPQPWGQWATIGLTLVCLMAMSAGELAATAISAVLRIPPDATSPSGSPSINGNLLILSTLFSTDLGWAGRRLPFEPVGVQVRDYLALRWPSAHCVVVSSVLMVILILSIDTANYLFGRPLAPPIIVGIYRTGRAAGACSPPL